ncbi:helix-turn-helix domain-containing protein [Citricoccus muralis]|uniref:Excisionase family DNA binding protein n=1 Tax=Citricoccus muralis TaxID=169134 RepID=A0A3D9LF28_9MICC|nr:helix-turn-helix domain-containing protein [Citricoccus muralis]REE04256.1 excisionase family DNA binding protein [Citricoccus muralis]
MAATMLTRTDVLVTAEDLTSVRHEVESTPAGLVGFAEVMSDGSVRRLPPELSKIIDKALRALAINGSVTVATLPDELTSNTAADVLGVSRPTLLKLARDGEVDSFSVGTHTRFKRDIILAFKAKREADRRESFAELQELEDQLDGLA